MRRFLLILAVVLFAMTAFAAIAPGLYRVNVNSTLNVRNAPGGAKIGSLSNGDLVQVTACEDDWAQVSLNDGRTGYVHEQYLEPFSTLAAPAGTSYSTVGLSELRHYTPFCHIAVCRHCLHRTTYRYQIVVPRRLPFMGRG